MKKLKYLIILALFGNLTVSAQKTDTNQNVASPVYCAMLRDGLMKVHLEGNYLISDLTLNNGTVITTDGTIIKRKGEHIVLQNGECVDTSGRILNPSGGYKADKIIVKIPPKIK